ncbi:pilus assembly protein [Delftia sp. PS-11]|uniref:pilus assembly protein n=1 Tax=Delftia sp. PS-11 TaxID=2767222 RepID=UPI002454D28A|nr:PilC/PilY family type IV pilus protein [Delftia sp. PS-11]KAJ8740882.1 pilus assembly protein PilY [Delftia sp. PS-11]
MHTVIHSILHRLDLLLPRTFRSWLAWSCGLLAITTSFLATGTGTPPSIPQVTLSQDPLYAATVVDKPTIALALSVEFPTVGAQYVTTTATDSTYSNTNEYLGYYDAESCYTYNDAPTETPATGLTAADYKRFDRSGAAVARKCTNAFSGNFLNWASSSAIDMLRLSLSGGDRYIDTDNLTILQRALLPNGDPICMWNSNNFPAKQLTKDGGGTNSYWGAVPQAMITQANGNDIWVANTLNRIYFGTSSGGGCGNTGSYTLGARQSSLGPITNGNNRPNGSVKCADENGTCTSNGTQEIWYGAQNSWKRAPLSGTTACSNGVFGDPLSGVVKACYLAPYTGNWQPSTASALNSDGFFYARVQVCNSSGGTLQDSRDYNLCRQYPNGNFKPTGAIQKYSDQMRLAAFGYLMDQTASYDGGRYGGVLRAPMKYVGSKTFNVYGQDNTPSTGNPKAEWNANTGVFYANPENDTMQISGVINYLNKFGRTGPVQGRYKRYDPVGELYYQSLRYLQGLQPTPDAIIGDTNNNTTMSDTLKDGYPVYTTWTDPYGDSRSDTADYSCLKSNIVVIGDINTHDGNWRNIPTTDNSAGNVPNFRTWHSLVRSFERNQAVDYVDGQGTTRTTGNPNGANNSVPSSSQTSQIMGYAYWAHTHDIRGSDWTTGVGDKRRPGLRVKTFIFDVNENGTQSSANTRRTSNQFFMAAKYGGFESDPRSANNRTYNTWGNPFKNQDGVNDNNVWQKTSDPGEASTYYLQSNARGVLNAFDEIFSRAATAARSISAPVMPANTVSATSGTTIYSAKFDTSNWSGDVVAETINLGTSSQLTVSAPLWSASEQLTNMTSPAANRKIFVGAGSATSNPAATTFTWSTINSTLQGYLNKASPTATADSRGEQRLNYLRGDRSQEGSLFRVRSSLLGDIINSYVVYSGAPSTGYSGTGYAAFRTSYDNRTAAVFAGANDGMLHAFNASNGSELFAYIPSWLGPRLSALTDNSFTNSHQSYVDGPLQVGEVQVASNGTASDWKTVLVGGTAAGGSGVFALDVSNPSNFTASNVMWEFTRADDSDMGQVIGQPQLIKLKVSEATATSAATYRWFAAVGSGVNNYVPESTNGPYSATGNPVLFLLALDKAVGTAWVAGTNYYKITLPMDTSLAATTAPGLAGFTPLYGGNGEVTDIFAGDLHGNVWKLRFSNVLPANWNMSSLSYFTNGNNAIPMYKARDGSTTPKVQPITVPPTIFTGPKVDGLETFYVAIVTGKFLEASDARSSDTNSFYVLFDNGSNAADSASASVVIAGRSRLAAGTVNTTNLTVSVSAFTWGRASSSTDSTQRSGWYFDLPSTGERGYTKIADYGSKNAALNSLIPGTAGTTAGTCNNGNGSGNAYVMNVATGATNYTVSSSGVLGPAMSIVKTEEVQTSTSDSTGRRIRTTPVRSVIFSTDGPRLGQTTNVSQAVGRLSWRQIFDYQDRKNQ